MTPDQIAEQARRDAEVWIEDPCPVMFDYNTVDEWKMDENLWFHTRNTYAAALIAERSKPQPSVEEVMEVWRKEAELHGTYSPHREERFRDRLTKLFNK